MYCYSYWRNSFIYWYIVTRVPEEFLVSMCTFFFKSRQPVSPSKYRNRHNNLFYLCILGLFTPQIRKLIHNRLEAPVQVEAADPRLPRPGGGPNMGHEAISGDFQRRRAGPAHGRHLLPTHRPGRLDPHRALCRFPAPEQRGFPAGQAQR